MAATIDTDTIIFVDVDGVLNVAAHHDEGPLLYTHENMEAIKQYAEEMRALKLCVDDESVLKLLSVSEKVLGSAEEGTYAKFICDPAYHVSGVLSQRLAQIILSAGDRHSVVLSSTWRHPRHLDSVKMLEEQVARHLGRPFVFDSMTKLISEPLAADRLRCIGDYIQSFCDSGFVGDRQLRCLLLEDFFITPLDGWHCDGTRIGAAEDVEAYLSERAPKDLDVSTKLVHTYDEWTTTRDLKVQAGVGLSLQHVHAAEAFLDREMPQPAVRPMQLCGLANNCIQAKPFKTLPTQLTIQTLLTLTALLVILHFVALYEFGCLPAAHGAKNSRLLGEVPW